MATAAFFHAHPDDESISTAGTMMLASAAGHRVVLVTATRGEVGEAPHLAADIDLGDVREAELREAAAELGVDRLELLGYRDSGMDGEPTNDHPDCFWQADVEEAAVRLATILREEQADLLTCYDSDGTYGHPDHIQVHRVGVRAAELADVGLVYEATVNRDHLVALVAAAADLDLGEDDPFDDERDDGAPSNLGVEGSRITHEIDVSSVIDRKRRAMALHGSQITEDSFFMKLTGDVFTMAFGVEWFIQRGVVPGSLGTDVFEPLPS
jgi:LmbE family N-acetylglucosaminyl deacetylase